MFKSNQVFEVVAYFEGAECSYGKVYADAVDALVAQAQAECGPEWTVEAVEA